MVSEDAGDVLVVLGEPDGLGVEGVFDGEVEPAVAAEQGSDAEWGAAAIEVEHEDSG